MGDDQEPPRRGRTPAERAGATPLDPRRLRADSMPVVRRGRRGGSGSGEDDTESLVPPGGSMRGRGRRLGPVRRSDPDEPVVIRRRRRMRSSRRWFTAAAVLAAVALVCGLAAWLTDPDVEAAAGAPPELVASTPLLSARRAPELVVRPVAARNLRESVAPVLEAAPGQSCLEVREGGEPLVAHRSDEPVVPASNLKVVLGAAALDLLEPETRLVTRFATDGAPTDGAVVRGNLYMVGGGDPMLTTDGYEPRFLRGVPPLTDLESVADRVASTGITEVTGSVVGDGSRYDDQRLVPSWPERYLAQGQVGPLGALIVDDGWGPGGPVPDPVLHAAQVMTDLLRERGVEIAGAPAVGEVPDGAPTLVDIPSLTVQELVGQLLAFSDNTTAELLLKEMGLRTGGEGSTEAGLVALAGWLDDNDLVVDGLRLEDGSGLSEGNRVTCGLLAGVLAQEGPEGPVAEGLAVPGESGTLNDRLLAAPLPDSVRAKTGTLRSTTALSGWLRTVPGSDLAFAFVINAPDGEVGAAELALQEQLLRAMLEHPRVPPLEQLVPAQPRAT